MPMPPAAQTQIRAQTRANALRLSCPLLLPRVCASGGFPRDRAIEESVPHDAFAGLVACGVPLGGRREDSLAQ